MYAPIEPSPHNSTMAITPLQSFPKTLPLCLPPSSVLHSKVLRAGPHPVDTHRTVAGAISFLSSVSLPTAALLTKGQLSSTVHPSLGTVWRSEEYAQRGAQWSNAADMNLSQLARFGTALNAAHTSVGELRPHTS